jgi:hypothetical protein
VHCGDAAALDALLRRHLPDLMVFVRAKSGPRLRAQESCSDLVQTVCREALQSVEHYEWRGEGSFRRWLFTLAMNKLRNRADYHAAERRDAARVVAGSDAVDATPGGFGPSQHAIAGEANATSDAGICRAVRAEGAARRHDSARPRGSASGPVATPSPHRLVRGSRSRSHHTGGRLRRAVRVAGRGSSATFRSQAPATGS